MAVTVRNPRGTPVILFLCGDVMTGRGVDQILARPGDPALRERYARSAGTYVALAEAANGPIPKPVDDAWPWGDLLAALDRAGPRARIANLETSVTARGRFAPEKAVHYRMSPANVGCLAAARLDVCVLANNHVLDFGGTGLLDTVDALTGAGIAVAGAGTDLAAARRPAVVPLPDGRRVLVFAAGCASSGIPAGWAAGDGRPGVHLLPDLTPATARGLVARIDQARRPGDVVVVSVHWGSNWGYDVPGDHVRFAHHLVEHGVDVVHGHSSHHPRPVEIHRDRLILYGCGDLVDDYEGITGYEPYRDDLRLAYLVALDDATGRLTGLEMLPFRAERMRLVAASPSDTSRLRDLLDAASRPFGTRIALAGPRALTVA
jgi:poly-gamma-glutamate capsule biosynthesis protein CapA/YwtB (metallophosphatase superfamily)